MRCKAVSKHVRGYMFWQIYLFYRFIYNISYGPCLEAVARIVYEHR